MNNSRSLNSSWCESGATKLVANLQGTYMTQVTDLERFEMDVVHKGQDKGY